MASSVSVIVVNYNGGERLTRCLASLLADRHPGRQLLIVDNKSTDGSDASLDAIAAKHSDVEVIRNPQNAGYAGGINAGLAAARGEFVAVLNMDVLVAPGWLDPLIAALAADATIGAVTPLVTLEDGRRVNAAGQRVHVTGLGFNRDLERAVTAIDKSPHRVSGIHGAAFVIRRALLARLGGMDASGFLYHEDVNLSWLLLLTGHSLVCVPTSVVRHDYVLSMSPDKLYLLERNRWAMLLADLRGGTRLTISPVLLLSEVILWMYCLLRGWSFLRAKAAAYRWVYRSRPAIRERRRFVESVRVISDWRLLRQLDWRYPIRQLVTLGRERGSSQRQPAGGWPSEAAHR